MTPATTASPAVDPGFDQRVAAVRRFNRFYTQQIGVLREGLLDSPFSLTEVRVLYELAHRDRPTAAELSRDLGLDAGYLSRILRQFQERGLVERRPSDADGRSSTVALTAAGREAFAPLDARTDDEVGETLRKLGGPEQRRLVDAMRTIQRLLGDAPDRPSAYLLRPHQPGDMGWVVHRQAVLYAQEYGWNEEYEALIARIVADFIDHFDAKRERCWIAERDGEVVGSVFVVKHPDMPDEVAKLRLLYVEPAARGLGIGRRLVQEVTRFARQKGYRKLTLWTNSVLNAARHIYQQEGYCLVQEAPHHKFGHDLVGQTWELEL